MSKFQQFKLRPDQFLTIITNVLYQNLLEANRTDAKATFNAVVEGKRVALVNVRMEDESEVRFDLVLDFSEYRGKRLNFKIFRDNLGLLIAQFVEKLNAEAEIPVFTEQQDGSLLFGVPAPISEDGTVSVLMLGAALREAGNVLLRLQYVDPDQFEQQPA